jgi:hypothetical protein
MTTNPDIINGLNIDDNDRELGKQLIALIKGYVNDQVDKETAFMISSNSDWFREIVKETVKEVLKEEKTNDD